MSDSKVSKHVQVRCDFFMASLDVRIYGRTTATLKRLDDAKIQAFKAGILDFDEGVNEVPMLFSGLADLEKEWLTGFLSAEKVSDALDLNEIPEDFSLEDIIKSL